MITATYKKKDDGMRCVHVVKDGKEIAHREFRSKRLAYLYASSYDKNFEKIERSGA